MEIGTQITIPADGANIYPPVPGPCILGNSVTCMNSFEKPAPGTKERPYLALSSQVIQLVLPTTRPDSGQIQIPTHDNYPLLRTQVVRSINIDVFSSFSRGCLLFFSFLFVSFSPRLLVPPAEYLSICRLVSKIKVVLCLRRATAAVPRSFYLPTYNLGSFQPNQQDRGKEHITPHHITSRILKTTQVPSQVAGQLVSLSKPSHLISSLPHIIIIHKTPYQ